MPNCGQNPIDHGALDHDDDDDKYGDDEVVLIFPEEDYSFQCHRCYVDSCSARPCNFCQKLSLVSRVR